MRHLVSDPAAVLDAPFYLGLLSHAGILLWAAAAAVAVFGSRLAHAIEPRRFLLAFGLLTALLALDDLLMLHEHVLPRLTGLPEWALVGGYAAAVGALGWRFHPFIARTDVRLLALALGLFCASVLVDLVPEFLGTEDDLARVPPRLVDVVLFVEAGSKFGGIVAWLLYATHTAARVLTRPPPTVQRESAAEPVAEPATELVGAQR